MIKKSIKAKFAWLYSLLVLFFVGITILATYILYCNTAGKDCIVTLPFMDKELFVIFACIMAMIGLLMVIMFMSMVDVYVTKPLNEVNEILGKLTVSDGDSKEVIFDDDMVKKLREYDSISSKELYDLTTSIKKLQTDVSVFITGLKEQEWEAEHDSMTMLYNKIKFEKRKEEVYPHVKSIYIACLDIINLNLVNTRLTTFAGDSIISKVARELRRFSSDTIHTYRLEDDHFAVVFCGYSEDEAVTMMEKWNGRLGRLNRSTDTFDCRIVWGGSFGEKNFNVDDVYKRADAEMYCKKMIEKKELAEI